MVSTLIPSADLAPSVTSRVLVVKATDFTEGAPATGEITFSLPWDVDVKLDKVILQAGSKTLTFDEAGQMQIRVPTADPDSSPDAWFLTVKKSWAPHAYAVRVPVGTTPINLVDVPLVQELPAGAAPGFLLTGAAATVTLGAEADVTTSVAGGIANFAFTLPDYGPQLEQSATAAAESAAAAAAAAESAAAAEDVVTRANAGEFVGPVGPEGPQGLPGINAVPAVEAMAGYIQDQDTSVSLALRAQFVRRGEAFVDVRDFGATGNGVADDTAALRAAHSSGAAVVFYPAGTYKTTGTITVGAASQETRGANAVVQLSASYAAFTLPSSAVSPKFFGMTMRGTMPSDGVATVQAQIGIKGYMELETAVSGLVIEGCRFENMQGTCIQIRHVTDFQIKGNTLTRYGYAGIGGLSVTRGVVTDNVLQGTGNLPAYSSNSYGIYMSAQEAAGDVGTAANPQSSDVVIARNTVSNQRWTALDTHVGQRISFINNTVRNCLGTAISAIFNDSGSNPVNARLSPRDILIQGNVIVYDALLEPNAGMNPGILLRGSVSTDLVGRQSATGVIQGNVVRRHGRQDVSTGAAIFVGGGSGVIVEGNTIQECRAVGIRVYDSAGTIINANSFVDLWRSTSIATAVYTELSLETSMALTVTNNRFVRGKLVVGTDLPAGAVVNNSSINGTNSAAITVTESGNDWGNVTSAPSHTRQTTGTQGLRVVDGTAAPTEGTWARGDQIRNAAPISGGYLGWVCITAGTPGTWRAYGAISST